MGIFKRADRTEAGPVDPEQQRKSVELTLGAAQIATIIPAMDSINLPSDVPEDRELARVLEIHDQVSALDLDFLNIVRQIYSDIGEGSTKQVTLPLPLAKRIYALMDTAITLGVFGTAEQNSEAQNNRLIDAGLLRDRLENALTAGDTSSANVDITA